MCRADPDLGAQEEDPWDWNVADAAAQATKNSRTKGANPSLHTYEVPITNLHSGILMHRHGMTSIIALFMPAHHAVGSRVWLCALHPQTLLTSPMHGGLRSANAASMTTLYDLAASKVKAEENDAVLPNKKAKKSNSTKSPSKPVKAIKQEAADNSAGAFPDLTNAPTHGPDEPLLLEHNSTHEGD